MAGECMRRIVRKGLYPVAQHRLMHTKVKRSLHIRHAAIPDQLHSLKLELAGKLPSLHDQPPVPLKHLTRCLRNRVQAILTYGLWMTVESDRSFRVGSKQITIPGTPQCCFTELKLSESRRH